MADGEGGASSGFFLAHQALALVAYGDPAALDGPAPGTPDILGKWGLGEGWWTEGRRTPPLMRLRWVWARVRWRRTRSKRHGEWRTCPLPPLPSEARTQVRHLMQRHGRPAADLMAELRADVERARLAAEDRERRLCDADRKLCEAIAAGAVPLDGRRGDADTGRFFRVIHECVPAAIFKNKHRSFLAAWGWATLRSTPDVPWDEWLHYRASEDVPDWGDLLFPKAAFLARFSQHAVETELSAVSEQAPPPPNEGGAPLISGNEPTEVNAPVGTMPVPEAFGRPIAPATTGRPLSVVSDPRLWGAEYMLRVERWRSARSENPGLRSPSEEDDWAWARARFGQVPRSTVRALRAKHAPECWRKSGKRSGAIWRE